MKSNLSKIKSAAKKWTSEASLEKWGNLTFQEFTQALAEANDPATPKMSENDYDHFVDYVWQIYKSTEQI
jgi:hypothetical protein